LTERGSGSLSEKRALMESNLSEEIGKPSLLYSG
jgi:hypothetical protein